jgi:hypothetical protein
MVALASVAVLFACAEAYGQKKSPPCDGYKGDAAKYADCMDTMEIRGAFNVVLGRKPTSAEFEKFKMLPPIKTTTHPGETRYVKLLLDWLVLPAQSNERLAVVDRAYESVSGVPATIIERVQLANAIGDKRLKFSRVRDSVLADLAVVELNEVPGNPASIVVRIGNLSQWGASPKATLVWGRNDAGCAAYAPVSLEFPVPSIAAGKNAWVTVKTPFRLHGMGHVGYHMRINVARDRDSNNNTKCVNPSIGTKVTPTEPARKIVREIKPKMATP